MTTLLVDGDVVAMIATVSTQEVTDWGDGLVTRFGNLDESRQKVDTAMAHYMETLKADRVIVCFSDREGIFRHSIFTDYKANRKESVKPVDYYDIVEYMNAVYECHTWPRLEADDVLGIIATDPEYAREEMIIVSIDKDMRTIPGQWANIRKDLEVEQISTFDANYHWMTQALTGDPVDGYKGLPQVGKVKAEKILDPCQDLEEMWNAVLEAFLDRGHSYDDCLTQVQLARILRREDYNVDGTINLWTPEVFN
tara:strand:+ start:12393 stop:13151 length:759 start_codon:yes stop_codon:yes gene_type:complete